MIQKFDANEVAVAVHERIKDIGFEIGMETIDRVRSICEREDLQEIARTTEVPIHLLALRILSYSLGHVIAACPRIDNTEIDQCVGIVKMTAEAFR